MYTIYRPTFLSPSDQTTYNLPFLSFKHFPFLYPLVHGGKKSTSTSGANAATAGGQRRRRKELDLSQVDPNLDTHKHDYRWVFYVLILSALYNGGCVECMTTLQFIPLVVLHSLHILYLLLYHSLYTLHTLCTLYNYYSRSHSTPHQYPHSSSTYSGSHSGGRFSHDMDMDLGLYGNEGLFDELEGLDGPQRYAVLFTFLCDVWFVLSTVSTEIALVLISCRSTFPHPHCSIFLMV